MKRLIAAAFVVSLVTLVLPAIAQADAQQPSAQGALSRQARLTGWVADRANPYSRLFEPTALPATKVVAPAGVPKPTIKCGMTLIPVDPRIDPEFARPRSNDSTRFTIRAVEPPICR